MSAFTNKLRHKLLKSHNHSLTQLSQKRRKKFKELEKLYKKKPEQEPTDGGKADRQNITDTFNELRNQMEEQQAQALIEFDAGKEAEETATAITSTTILTDNVSTMSINNNETKTGKKKLSRYEKRKQKQLKEDAKIDQERAAIEANQENQKEVEMAALNEQLDPLGFTIQDIKADGHCLFTSIAHQLALRSGDTLGNKACFEMRQIATSHMKNNPNDFSPFIEGDLNLYLENMANTASWGGQIEIQALSDALKTPVEVYAAGQPVITMGETYGGVSGNGLQPLRVTYQRKYYTLGEHYNSVVPK